MLNINLLPWRESWRKKQCNNFLWRLLLSLLAGVVMVILAYSFLSWKIGQVQSRITQLERKSAQSSLQIHKLMELNQRKEKLDSARNIMQLIQEKQLRLAWFLARLGDLTPQGVQLEALKIQEKIALEGQAISYGILAKFINKIESAQLIKQLQLSETKSRGGNVIDFSLQGFL